MEYLTSSLKIAEKVDSFIRNEINLWKVVWKVIRKVAWCIVKLYEAMYFEEINNNNNKSLTKVG